MGFLGDLLKGVSGAVPVAGPLLSGLIGGFQGREENRAAQDAANLYNQFWGPGGTREQGANALVNRLAAAGYDPFGPQTTSQTGTTFGTSAQDSRTRGKEASQTRKVLDPRTENLFNLVRGGLEKRLGEEAVTPGEIARTVAQNNRLRDVAMNAAMSEAGAKNLGATQRGALGIAANREGMGRNLDFLASIPQLERSRRNEDWGIARGLWGDLMGSNQNRQFDSRTTGTTTSTGGSTGTTTGGPDMSMLANLFLPQSPLATTKTGQNPWLNAAQDATTALTGLWGGRPTTPPINPLPPARGATPFNTGLNTTITAPTLR